jgi:glycosyltransferase involved in cell wall biosynthesis
VYTRTESKEAMTMEIRMVSVVIPTLNEAGNIRDTLKNIEKALRYPKEIIIVDGDSTDGTKEIVEEMRFCRLIVEPRRGYGLALRTGIRYSKGDVVVMVDGDGTYEVRHINRLLRTMIKKDAEMCLATRMFDPNKAMGFMNFVANKIITMCFNFVYQQFLSDTQSGFRAISRSAIEKVDLDQDDMAFATEMLVQFAKKGFRMIEVNSTYKPRKYGRTKLRRVKSGIEIFTTLVKGITK